MDGMSETFQQIAEQTATSFHYTSGTIILLTNVGSILTNASVLFVLFVKDRKFLSSTNWYIAAICIMSLIMAVFGAPMVIISCFNQLWLFGETGCKYYSFLMTFGGLSTMLMLCSIAVDRYVYVVKHEFSAHLSTSFSVNLICINVFLSFGIASGPLLGWNKFTYEGVGTSCALDLSGKEYSGISYVLTLLIGYFIVPITIMIVSYGSICLMIRKATNQYLRTVRTFQECRTQKKSSIERKSALTMSLIIVCFLICYSPYACLLLWMMIKKNENISPIIMAVPSLITKTGGAFTPLIFLARSRKLRNQVLNLYPCFRKHSTISPENVTIQQEENNVHVEIVPGNESV